MFKFIGALIRNFLWLIGVAGVVAAALIGGNVITSGDEQTRVSRRQLLTVEVFAAQIADRYETRRRFPGRINSAQVADLSFQVGGEITAVDVEIGDRVQQGAALARLDPVRLELRAREAKAALGEAEAELKRAQASLERTRELFADGFATSQDNDDAIAARDSARERVVRLRRSADAAAEDLDDAMLVAPFSGAIVARYLDAGTVVNAGQPVLRINQDGKLEAQIGVPGDLAADIEIGQAFDLEVAGRMVSAMVQGIGDDIEEATRSVAIRFSINEVENAAAASALTPGALVRLVLAEERRGRGAWVPLSAIVESYRGLWSVFVVVDEDNVSRIRRKDVTIVAIGEDRVYVDGTIEDGDRVVRAAPFRFVPGQEVKVVGGADRPLEISKAHP